jgi:hypothetical protein
MHRLERIQSAEAEATTINWTPANRPAHRTPRVYRTRDGSLTRPAQHRDTFMDNC